MQSSDKTNNPYSIKLRMLVVGLLIAITIGMAVLFFPKVKKVETTYQVRPDILIVTFDTLRADHCSLYGYQRKTTPNLDRLAADGVAFDRAYAPMATTAPSHATLMTSLYPLNCGVIRNGFVLAQKYETLARRLKQAGYSTGAFVSSFVLFHKFGLDQGFDRYDDDFTQSQATQKPTDTWEGIDVPGGKTDRRADATTDRALAWLDAVRPARRVPIFMWVHYMDPHEPYDPPSMKSPSTKSPSTKSPTTKSPTSFGDPFGMANIPPNTLQQAIARYDTEIAFADQQLGRLVKRFEAKALRAGALVIVAGDHGESFVEHGWRGHGTQLYEESLRVPLVLHWHKHLLWTDHVKVPVALQDVAVTVLSLTGVHATGGFSAGHDLVPLLMGADHSADDRPLFFQRRFYDHPGVIQPIALPNMNGMTFGRGIAVAGPKFGVLLGRWKFLQAPQEDVPVELYDLDHDPGEMLNVAADHPDLVERFSQKIASWRKSQVDAYGLPRAQLLSAQDKAVLKTLGYVDPDEPPLSPIEKGKLNSGGRGN